MPGGHSIDVPFTVLRGRERDPVVWMMAARDGDEVHATLVAMDLQRRLSPEMINGSLIVLPIGNVPRVRRAEPRAPARPDLSGA
jgi:predicted deacylase